MDLLRLASNWTGSGLLLNQLDEPLLVLQSAKLCDLYSEHGWDSNWLSLHLPVGVVQFVCSFSFHFIDEPDRQIWEPNASGLFSVASAYHVLHLKHARRPALNLIWGSRIPICLSIFFWHFLNNLLLFLDIL